MLRDHATVTLAFALSQQRWGRDQHSILGSAMFAFYILVSPLESMSACERKKLLNNEGRSCCGNYDGRRAVLPRLEWNENTPEGENHAVSEQNAKRNQIGVTWKAIGPEEWFLACLPLYRRHRSAWLRICLLVGENPAECGRECDSRLRSEIQFLIDCKCARDDEEEEWLVRRIKLENFPPHAMTSMPRLDANDGTRVALLWMSAWGCRKRETFYRLPFSSSSSSLDGVECN